MAAPMKAGIPPSLDLNGSYVLQFTALSPTDGSVVAGVTVSSASLLVDNVGAGSESDLQVGPFMLVPGPKS